MSLERFENLIWHALSGPHARFAQGGAVARRYAPGFSPILGFADRYNPDFGALDGICQVGEHFYCEGWSGPAPAGWQIEFEATMLKMAWTGDLPAEHGEGLVRLGPEHAEQALALAQLTKPGPFGLRTVELGEYFGVIENGQLMAMAGERMHALPLREISGVATHPDARGQGLAGRLMNHLVRRQMQRGEQPVLHVMSGNAAARQLYERIGWRQHLEVVVRVIARIS
ncbi:MAG TPA: GNAT family N-acetyltransferase [Burkholderiaceae bacterium]